MHQMVRIEDPKRDKNLTYIDPTHPKHRNNKVVLGKALKSSQQTSPSKGCIPNQPLEQIQLRNVLVVDE